MCWKKVQSLSGMWSVKKIIFLEIPFISGMRIKHIKLEKTEGTNNNGHSRDTRYTGTQNRTETNKTKITTLIRWVTQTHKKSAVLTKESPRFLKEEFEDTKGVIRIRKSKTDNNTMTKEKDKRTNNDLQKHYIEN